MMPYNTNRYIDVLTQLKRGTGGDPFRLGHRCGPRPKLLGELLRLEPCAYVDDFLAPLHDQHGISDVMLVIPRNHASTSAGPLLARWHAALGAAAPGDALPGTASARRVRGVG